ncbi:hypothetical protein NDU88_003087 [Pleurodeles waltl]|uniref:Uncharacterized protein n=1 Tax=Pleurodeles waltl TaxID=8319 RepID=A0AAV7PDP3_PLEWA|nr:hypothetical protein NDU88_003087 [Pleurodeles waltl]
MHIYYRWAVNMGCLRPTAQVSSPAAGPPSPTVPEMPMPGASTDSSMSDKLDHILAAIEHSRRLMEAWFGLLISELSFLRNNITNLLTNSRTKKRLFLLYNPKVTDHNTAIYDLQAGILQLERCVEDVEVRSLRSNIRILALTEGVFASKPVAMYQAALESDELPGFLQVSLLVLLLKPDEDPT